MLNYPIEVIA